MPLAGHGRQFVLVAEKYGLPYNLLPAIAVQESIVEVCKNKNPFGWGSCEIKFHSFNEAIEVVGKNLATGSYYKNKSLDKKLLTYNSENKNYRRNIFSHMRKIDKL